MRKWGAAVVTGALLIALASPLYAAAPKAGATCPKKNATATSAGKLYTCIQSGKKLIWNKGMTLPKPSSTPTPTSTPTATPIESSKPTDPFAKYGNNAERYKAVDEYGQKLAYGIKADVSPILTNLQSPNDQAVLRMTRNAQYAYSLYEQLMPLGYTPKFIVGENGDWVKNQVKDICPNLVQLMPNQGSANCRLAAVWRAIDVRNDSLMQEVMLVQGGHEFFHLYQQEHWGRNWSKVPDWIREGSANVGMGIVLTHFENRKSYADYGEAQGAERNSKDRNSCEASLARWEANAPADGFGFNNGCEYGLGLIMNEYLIMKGYTLNHIIDLIKLIGAGSEFPAAFNQVYKISTADFFRDIRSYLKTLDYGW